MKKISNNILKSIDVLKKFNNTKKFNPKKNYNFIHMYLLYIQNNYNLDFNFKDYTIEKSFIKCLNSLYKTNNKRKLFLFSEIKLLGSLFFKDKKFNLEKFLNKLETDINSTNYVSSNIEIIDYLGNAENDINIINHGYCLLLLKELYPDIKISKTLSKSIINNLLKTTEFKNNICYTNTQALMLLFLLNKSHLYKNLDKFIIKLLNSQQTDGSLNNGFNKYLIDNPYEKDILHTIFNLIVLLEYKIIKKTENIITSPNKQKQKQDPPKKIVKQDKNKIKSKKNKKEVIEKFNNILTNNDEYYLDLNFYNVSAICLIILIIFISLKYYKININ